MSAPVACSWRRFLLMAGMTIATLLPSARVRGATQEEVDAAVKRGIDWLYSQQNEDGHWDHILKPNDQGKFAGDVKQVAGPTALVIYAMLTAGENPKDPRAEKALAYLREAQTQGTYAMGFRAQAYALLPLTPQLRQLAARDADWLKTAQRHVKDQRQRGFYGYGSGPKSGCDRSTSQIAVLGAWACAYTGNDLGEDYWRLTEQAWGEAQQPDGGWNYWEGRPASLAMTAAGVATLEITYEYLHSADSANCQGGGVLPAIERGVQWLATNFGGGEGSGFNAYTLYAVERAGSASGYKYFGEHNWYKEGTDWILPKQNKENGAWSGSIVDTSFAVLFLTRSRAPIAMAKLRYGTEAPAAAPKPAAPESPDKPKRLEKPIPVTWSLRARDVANVTRWMGRQIERPLNWEILTCQQPLTDFFDAPILFIAGNEPLTFTKQEMSRLREYVEGGGMILGNADCSNPRFVESFKKLGSKLFPAYEFRALPATHPIFTDQQFAAANWKTPVPIMGLTNGSRELMLLFPKDDPGRNWQMRTINGREQYHQVMSDIYLYAIGREQQAQKGITHYVVPDPEIKPERTMKVARIKYAGNWDPEPGGWRRLAALLHNQKTMELTTEPLDVSEEGKLDNSYPLAHLTGTAAGHLTDTNKAQLKKYVDGGGTLLVDACGGSSDFAKDVLVDLCSVFAPGKNDLDPIAADHKVFTAEPKLGEVKYRATAKKLLGDAAKGLRLRGLEVNGRLAVIFSPEDLSTGLVGHAVDGVIGYEPKTALDIIWHVVLASAPVPAPTTAPTTKPDENNPNAPTAENKPPEQKKE